MTDATVARTILEQVGVGTRMAIGARDMMYGDDSLTMRVGSSNVTRHIRIRLDPNDTYSIRYTSINRRNFDVIELENAAGVYCDNLSEV